MADTYVSTSSSGDGTWFRFPFKDWDDVNKHMPELIKGEVITIQGVYRKRAFWEWLVRKPRELQEFVIA